MFKLRKRALPAPVPPRPRPSDPLAQWSARYRAAMAITADDVRVRGVR